MPTDKQRDQARERKQRQRDRNRAESVTNVTESVTRSRTDVTPNPYNYQPPIQGWKGMGTCRDCNLAVARKDNTCHAHFFGK